MTRPTHQDNDYLGHLAHLILSAGSVGMLVVIALELNGRISDRFFWLAAAVDVALFLTGLVVIWTWGYLAAQRDDAKAFEVIQWTARIIP